MWAAGMVFCELMFGESAREFGKRNGPPRYFYKKSAGVGVGGQLGDERELSPSSPIPKEDR